MPEAHALGMQPKTVLWSYSPPSIMTLSELFLSCASIRAVHRRLYIQPPKLELFISFFHRWRFQRPRTGATLAPHGTQRHGSVSFQAAFQKPPPVRPVCFPFAAAYPAGAGRASIRRTMAPNRPRVRCRCPRGDPLRSHCRPRESWPETALWEVSGTISQTGR